MILLVISGLTVTSAGLFFLLFPDFVKQLGESNRPLVNLDIYSTKVRLFVSLAMLAAGLAILFCIYPEFKTYWYLTTMSALSLFLAFCFLAVPNATLAILNKVLLPTDKYVIKIRNLLGAVLVLIGVYILLSAYYLF